MKNLLFIALFASQTLSHVTFQSPKAVTCNIKPYDGACCGTAFDPQSPAVQTVRGGELIEVSVKKNGHSGGRVEWAFVPVEKAHSWDNFDQYIFMYTCYESNTKVPVPPHLHGVYTLRYRWTLGAETNGFKVGVPDWTSCVNYEIVNENPTTQPQCPIFVGNAIDGDQPACKWLVPDSQEIVYSEGVLRGTCKTRRENGQTCTGTTQVGVFKEVEDCDGAKYLRKGNGDIVGWEGWPGVSTSNADGSSNLQRDDDDETQQNPDGMADDAESNSQVVNESTPSQQVDVGNGTQTNSSGRLSDTAMNTDRKISKFDDWFKNGSKRLSSFEDYGNWDSWKIPKQTRGNNQYSMPKFGASQQFGNGFGSPFWNNQN